MSPLKGALTNRTVLLTMGVILPLLLWQLISSTMLDSDATPAPTSVIPELVNQFGDYQFWTDCAYTLRAWALGLLASIIVGTPIGLAIGRSQVLNRALRVPIEAMRPMPSVALIPLAVLTLGIGLKSEFGLILYASVWPILIQSLYGAQDVDPTALDTGRALGLPRTKVIRSILIPSTAPYIVTGIRLSATTALILAITVELVTGSPGLGRSILEAENGLAYSKMYALILTTGILALIINAVLIWMEGLVLAWHPRQREKVGPS